MTDVRLVATNPDDGLLVPVASNASGQLAVQSPKIEKIPNDIEVDGAGTFAGPIISSRYVNNVSMLSADISGVTYGYALTDASSNLIVGITTDGEASFSGPVTVKQNLSSSFGNEAFVVSNSSQDQVIRLNNNGSAKFSGDVVIGSRGSQWLIRESNGVAMLVEQTRRGVMDQDPDQSKVRDLPRELDLIEAALNEVMEKLRMTPPAGWEVWDGSDNSQ